MAFKISNNYEDAQDHCKAQLMAVALRLPPLTPRQGGKQCMPPGACFKCNQRRHWEKAALHLAHHQDPVQSGHWKSDFPSLSLQGRSVSHSYC
jgi:hypothetical protein